MHPELRDALQKLSTAIGYVFLPIAMPVLVVIFKSWLVLIAGLFLYGISTYAIAKYSARASDKKGISIKQAAFSCLFIVGIVLANYYYNT
ncbi:hypothetical protein ACJJID_06110 [Microbulbifer sp. CnH-101-G]|uniref:hypothetical protein n=1 Tax=Microbulbifer sp. CnH-101-G TaxID=3243393 RepID=UPI00403978AE